MLTLNSFFKWLIGIICESSSHFYWIKLFFLLTILFWFSSFMVYRRFDVHIIMVHWFLWFTFLPWLMPKFLLSTQKVSGSKLREAQHFSKPFWIFLRHIISSVHPTRWPRVISRNRYRNGVVSSLLPADAHLSAKRGRKLRIVPLIPLSKMKIDCWVENDNFLFNY